VALGQLGRSGRHAVMDSRLRRLLALCRQIRPLRQTFGSLGAVVVLLTWFYLSAYVVLLGACLNAEMERQTARDTTHSPERPLGQRGAKMADTVAN
jgi:membrane protein